MEGFIGEESHHGIRHITKDLKEGEEKEDEKRLTLRIHGHPPTKNRG